MRNIFIINPCAGQGKNFGRLQEEIEKASKKTGMATELYYTKGVGDAESFTRQLAKSGEDIRFFACGGDGTLNEVVNGTFGFPNAKVGVVPIGTGNDFVRNFGKASNFMNIEKQLLGQTVKVDLIEYSNDEKTRYCANMINIGFDCNVVDKTAEMKKKPLVSGSGAYLLSVFAILAKKKGANLKVTVDGKVVHDGPNLLCAIANGSYCGGGVYSSPQAKTDDGLMDVNVVLDMPRTQFIKLFPYYKKGTHFGVEGIEKMVHAFPAKETVIEPLDGIMKLCVDGEIEDIGTIKLRTLEKAFEFIVPKK
ncbi:MAG: hypothetical protein MJ146_01425 [Clostridia bacterium]|nr:hypothetical protein [Clostridia bacterium]